ncbi:MAG: DegV family protein [Actinomycetia bacterium]|nr:DegV family protein [Actinomycetes bacterium]
MSKIAVVTDSSSDIPQKIAHDLGISIIPMYINIEGKSYKEGREINNEQVYKALADGYMVRTSGPSAADFMEVFTRLFDEKIEKIYTICLSSKLSGTLNSALLAQRNFKKGLIKIIDSRNTTISMGLLVTETARLAKLDLAEDELESKIAYLIEETSFYAAIENFKYVFRSGRTPFLGKFLSKALIFKPVVSINSNGKIYLKSFSKSKQKAILKLYKQTITSIDTRRAWRIGIFYGDRIQPALDLKQRFEENNKGNIREIILSEVTTVISAHTGPGIWGVAYSPILNY